MPDILQFDPLTLIVLFIAGWGVIYVVRMFIQAQNVREKEMWAAMQTMMKDVKEINDSWLATYQLQGDKSSEAVNNNAAKTAALTTEIAHLTAAINKSIETGANLQGASSLMVEILKEGNGRKGVRSETK